MNYLKLTTNRILSKNQITIDGNSLTIAITDTNEQPGANVDIPSFSFTGTFDLADLAANYSQDHGCIAVHPYNMMDGGQLVVTETTQLSLPEKESTGDSYTSFDTTAGKYYSGSPFSVVSTRYKSYCYLYILTPYVNCSVDDLIIVYRDTSNAEITVNNSGITSTAITSMKAYLDTWLPVTVSGPTTITAGTSQSYTVTAPEGTTVYLTLDNGITNRTKVKNGQSFLLNTDGLTAGEVVTVKLGYKYWASVSEFQITLS